jgi:cytidylate kinase
MGVIIAIDGPSGAGKTTIAQSIARELGYVYLDTGALYRAVALVLRKSSIEPEEPDKKIDDILRATDIAFEDGSVLLHGEHIDNDIRSQEIDHYSSVFSARKIIRDYLLTVQRNAGMHHNLVAEGRDTTTIVFPEADVKFFLDASVEERAKRRFLQYIDMGINVSMENARKGIIERDERDANRDIAPLRIASDALVVDSSGLSVDQVLKKMLHHIRNNT